MRKPTASNLSSIKGGKTPANHPTKHCKQKTLAVPTGLEPVTFGLGNRCSIRLSYGTI
jgi:hypothetical protein